MTMIDLNQILPTVLAILAGVAWLFRLEAKAGAKADESSLQSVKADVAALKVECGAIKARDDAQDVAIKTATDGHNMTTIEVVRLQEQIKHLTEMISRLLPRDDEDAQPRRRRAVKDAG